MQTEIEPCPLCGAPAVIDACEGGTDGLFFVSCTDDRCECIGPRSYSAVAAVLNWNGGIRYLRHAGAIPAEVKHG